MSVAIYPSEAIIWNAREETKHAALTGGIIRKWWPVWRADGQLIAAASYGRHDTTIGAWRAKDGKFITRIADHDNPVRRLEWQPEGDFLATVGRQSPAVHLWRPTLEKQGEFLIGHADEVTAIAWKRDGTVFTSGDAEGRVYFWDPATKRAVDILRAHDGRIDGLSWSPDGTELLTVSGSDAKLWKPFDYATMEHIGVPPSLARVPAH